ncbi:MAG: DUF2911 domain-containing protein [Cyclobacteriaceae bacterium]|nr:DUF2911 domain-containing protein [Cyclobacteriaceae bacterium]
MRKVLQPIALVAGLLIATTSFAQITTPRTPSPAAQVQQTIGISTITINYSRPAVRGREVWGVLVPYGYNNLGFGTATEAPWRAGANENTTITFSDNAKVEGQPIPAGTYALFVGVHEDGKADIIFSKNSTSWGSFFYDKKEDQLRVQVQTQDHAMTELLTYEFTDLTKNSATVALDWEKKRFPFKVEFDVDAIVLNNARNELRNATGFSFQGPLSAANYCIQNNINHEEAMQWADQAIAANPNFAGYFAKARIYDQMGKQSDADANYDKSVELANKPQLNFMGYQMMGKNRNEKALEYFKLNVKRNPKDANVHDSLGECYRNMGDTKAAIKEFKTSLSLNPIQGVKANSIRNLKELGVDTSSYE